MKEVTMTMTAMLTLNRKAHKNEIILLEYKNSKKINKTQKNTKKDDLPRNDTALKGPLNNCLLEN